VTVEAPVTAICSSCGSRFDLSARNAREHRRQGTPVICRVCRFPATPADPRRLAALRQWWLDRYELAELRSWPPL
jgi:hypothetical protein